MDSRLTLGALSTCMEAYGAFCKPLCRELGLPQTAFDILMFLSNNPEHSTAKEISSLRGLKENIISINVNKLVGEGYLLRQNDPEDRRKVHLRCTEKAAPIIARGRQLQNAFSERLFAGMDEEARRAFSEAMHLIEHNLNELLGADEA